jgi:PAB-dependent poly(A)-specific ribonuclease subunit 3
MGAVEGLPLALSVILCRHQFPNPPSHRPVQLGQGGYFLHLQGELHGNNIRWEVAVILPATPTVVLTAGELLQRHHSKLLFGRTVSVLVLFETPMEYFRVRADHVFTVTIADHQQLEYPHGAADNSWQQFGPISIPAGPPPPPTIRSLHALPDGLWRYFRDMSFESQREMDVSDPRNKAIPPAWGNAFPLDAPTGNKNVRSSFGYPISTFKVVSREDGYLYCLRRADNVRSVSNKIAQTVSDSWATAVTTQTQRAVLDHPGLVRFFRCFVANRAVFFIHQYCPGARTLRERFFASNNPGPLPEGHVWSCVTQLVAAIRAVHGANLACRTLQLNHILCHGEGRIRLRINCLGMVDALEFEARKQIGELQTEDMRDLGRLILSLATGIEVTKTSDGNTIRRCDVFVAQNCSPELHSLIVSLLLPNKPTPSVFAIANAIANYAMDEL